MYQVLTNQGFKNFESFLNQGMSRELLKISFSDNTILKCTAEHQLLLDDEYIEAQFLIIGDIISGKEICNIESIELNDQLVLLEAHSNQLNSIQLNHHLEEAILWDNPLEYIKLNPNLRSLDVSHPKNHNIEIDNSINNEKVEIYYTIN